MAPNAEYACSRCGTVIEDTAVQRITRGLRESATVRLVCAPCMGSTWGSGAQIDGSGRAR
jgi:DNA-directed RNA polymerase subunit RPC12/RpoP